MESPYTLYMYASICPKCKHYRDSLKDGGMASGKCDAFPDTIPMEIFTGKVDHRSPVPGDNGIQFEPSD